MSKIQDENCSPIYIRQSNFVHKPSRVYFLYQKSDFLFNFKAAATGRKEIYFGKNGLQIEQIPIEHVAFLNYNQVE